MPLHVIQHPLVQHKLGLMREASISTKAFRELTNEMGTFLTYEATQDFPLERHTITNWSGYLIEIKRVKGKKVTLVPILRAGLGMLGGVSDLIPNAKISMVGLYRDEETLQPESYFERLVHDIDQRTALVLDPMLATGGSMVATIDLLKRHGCTDIRVLSIIAAPEGVDKVLNAHPDIHIYVAAVDSHLDENGYIVPGLGDAGDKIFGTR